jgi:riboflavin synthase
MFTGLVTDLGTLALLHRKSGGMTFSVDTAYDVAEIEVGESISVDGVCLTVTRTEDSKFWMDASPETLARTTLGARKRGDRVHLERALRLSDRLGGHLVLGHVDGVGTVRSASRDGNMWRVEIDAPGSVSEFLLEKGAITVDGVSLTVNGVSGNTFDVAIIPHTAETTKLGEYRAGHHVNLEADVLGKYVKKLMGGSSGIDQEKLEEYGFLERGR